MVLVLIVLTCDDLMSESKKTTTLCYNLYEQSYGNFKQRKELFKLAKYVRSNVVNITAANFFIFDKSAILGMLGSFATYAIIILQFLDKN